MLLFILLSLACLRLSSNKSLTAVTPNTNSTGNMAISLPKALIAGTQFSSTINMKYKLATRWNCSRRLRGRNDSNVYLVVRIRLSGRLPFGCSLRGVFGGTVWFGTTIRNRSSRSFFGLRRSSRQRSRRHIGSGGLLRNVYTLSEREACLQQQSKSYD